MTCFLYPFPRHRVYDVKNTEFMSSGCLLEMGVNLLNQGRLGLKFRVRDQHPDGFLHNLPFSMLTCTWSMHNFVIASTLAPDTPGGLRACKACRCPSKSSTAGMITALFKIPEKRPG